MLVATASAMLYVVEGGHVVGVESASDVVERERGPDVKSRVRGVTDVHSRAAADRARRTPTV